MRKFFLTMLLLAAPVLALAATPPRPFTADYEVLRNDQRLGTGQVSLQRRGDGLYELTTRTQGTEGLAALAGVQREERSLLRWTGNGLQLVEGSMRQKAAFKTREQRVAYAGGQVDSRWKDQSARYAAPPQVLDAHGTTAAIMAALANGQQGTLRFPVANRGALENHTYVVAAPVRLRTAIGTERAVRVQRVREDGNGRITKLWFARERGWLPLRIKQYEPDGETIDLRITAVR